MRRLLLVLALVAWGCSFGALEGFSGGDDGGAAIADSGSERDETAEPPPDAGEDVVVTPPEPLTGCAGSKSTLCRDFDDGSVDQSFDGIEAQGTQTIEIVDGGLHTRIDQLVSSKGIVRLFKTIPLTAKRTRVSFDLKVTPPAAVGTSGYFSVAEFLCGPDGNQAGTFLQFAPSDAGPQLAVRGSNFTYRMGPLPGEWTRVTLDVRWEATYADVSVFYGTQIAFAKRIDNLTCATNAPFRLVIGLSSNNLGEAYYDNVVYDLDPT